MANNWDNLIEKYFPADEIPKLKELFAKLMAKYDYDTDMVLNDAEFYKAFNGDVGCRMWAINNWSFDPDIKLRIEYYLDQGANEILPSKARIARMILDISQKCHNPRDKLNALKEYVELMGFNKEEQTVNAGATQNVILVTDNGSDMTWEEKLRKNQYDIQKRADEVLGLDDETKH